MSASVLFVLIGTASSYAQDSLDVGRIAYQQARYADAVEVFEEALDLERSFELLTAIAHCRVQLGQWSAAVEAFGEAAAISDPQDAAFHEAFGIALHGIGEDAVALRRLRRAVSLDPSGDAGLAMGRILSLRGEWRLAEHVLLSYLTSRPEDVSAIELLATVLANDGRSGEAANLCRRLVRLEPWNIDHWVLLGQCEASAGRLTAAMDSLEVAVRLGHRGDAAIRLLADIYLSEGLYSAAVSTYELFIGGADSSDAHDLRRYSLALSGAGEPGRARSILERAFSSEPPRLGIALDFARLAEQAGSEAEAYEAYVVASRLSGSGAVALAQFELRRGFPDRAAEAFSLAIKQGEREPTLYVESVRALLQSGNREAALEQLRAGLREHPFHDGLRSLLSYLARSTSGQ